MDLFKDIMPSLNAQHRRSIIREQDGKIAPYKAKEVEGHSFIINRLLSYKPDCLFYVAEINCIRDYLYPGASYEFLLNAVPSSSAYVRMSKPEPTSELIKTIMQLKSCSQQKAKELAMFLSEDDKKELLNKGGRL